MDRHAPKLFFLEILKRSRDLETKLLKNRWLIFWIPDPDGPAGLFVFGHLLVAPHPCLQL